MLCRQTAYVCTMISKKETLIQQVVLATAHNDYSKGLNTRAYFKVHDHDLGEDLVQDTFMKTWSYLVKGGQIDMMKAFLYHILNNLIIDQYRKHKTDSLDVLIENGFEPRDTDPPRFLDILDGKGAIALIAHLPETYKKVMKMKFIQHLSLKEMSILTGQTKNGTAVQIHRGLEKLKCLYENRLPIIKLIKK